MNLQVTTRIDQYLTGEMSAEERNNFENELRSNAQLKQEVELQTFITGGIKLSAQRQLIKQTARTYRFQKTMKWLAIGGVIALSAAALTYYLLTAQSGETIQPERGGSDNSGTIEMPTDTIGTADTTFINSIESSGLPYEGVDAQYFTIPEKGGVVLSEKGVLLSIPQNAFLKNNVAYSGPVVLQYQEALEGSDIVKSGLSTTSGNDLLETRGMISLTAYTPQQEMLEVNPQVGVYVQMPVSNLNSDMMLFDGVLNEAGIIHWQNPEALEKIPVPVDMALLDFYPPTYESKLDELKWKKDKHSRDSLYMSFENWGNQISDITAIYLAPFEESISVDALPNSNGFNNTSAETPKADTLSYFSGSSVSNTTNNRLLPSRVMGFWNSQFNNTILATREFEKRMKVIHQLCQPEILSIYTNNINRPLYQMDKDAAKAISAEAKSIFEDFAAERVGSIVLKSPHFEQLKEFYSKSVKALSEAQKKIFEEERARQQKWDIEVSNERMRERLRTQQQNSQTFNQEFALNLENVYRQLGLTASFTIRGGGGRRSGTVMKNVDAFVRSATRSRVTATYVDNTTGKKAKIVYNEFSFEVPDAGKYRKLFAYLLPNKFQSYQRLNVINGKLSYNLNNEMMYDLVVLGLTDTGFEYFEKQKINKGHLGIVKMEMITEDAFNDRLSKLDDKRESQLKNMSDEFAWLVKERANYEVQKQRREMAEFRREVVGSVYPCQADTVGMRPKI